MMNFNKENKMTLNLFDSQGFLREEDMSAGGLMKYLRGTNKRISRLFGSPSKSQSNDTSFSDSSCGVVALPNSVQVEAPNSQDQEENHEEIEPQQNDDDENGREEKEDEVMEESLQKKTSDKENSVIIPETQETPVNSQNQNESSPLQINTGQRKKMKRSMMKSLGVRHLSHIEIDSQEPECQEPQSNSQPVSSEDKKTPEKAENGPQIEDLPNEFSPPIQKLPESPLNEFKVPQLQHSPRPSNKNKLNGSLRRSLFKPNSDPATGFACSTPRNNNVQSTLFASSLIYSPIRNSAGSSKEKIGVADNPAKVSRIPPDFLVKIQPSSKLPAPEIADSPEPTPILKIQQMPNSQDPAVPVQQEPRKMPKTPTRIRTLKEIEKEVEVVYQLEAAREKPAEETPENPKTPRQLNKTGGADVSMEIDEDPVSVKSTKKIAQNNRTTHNAINIVETPVASRPVDSDESYKNLKEKLKNISNDSSSSDDITSDEENEKDKEPEKKKRDPPMRPLTPRNLTPLLNAEYPGFSTPKSPGIRKTLHSPAPAPKSPFRFPEDPENLDEAPENSVPDAEIPAEAPESPRRSARLIIPAKEEIQLENAPKLKVILTSEKVLPEIQKITKKKQMNVTFEDIINPTSGSDVVSPTMVNSVRRSLKNAGKPNETCNVTFAVPKLPAPRKTLKKTNPVVANYLEISNHKATMKKKQQRKSLADESRKRTLYSHDDDDQEVAESNECQSEASPFEVAVQQSAENELLENPENSVVEQEKEKDVADGISGSEEEDQEAILEPVASHSPEKRENPTKNRKKPAVKKTQNPTKPPAKKKKKQPSELKFLTKYGPVLNDNHEEEEQEEAETETTGVRRSKRGLHLRKAFFSADPKAQEYALIYGVCNPREEQKREKLQQKARNNLELLADTSSIKDIKNIKNSINLTRKMSVSEKPRTKNSKKVQEVIEEEDEEEPETAAIKNKETKKQKQQQNKSRAAGKKKGKESKVDEPMVEQPEENHFLEQPEQNHEQAEEFNDGNLEDKQAEEAPVLQKEKRQKRSNKNAGTKQQEESQDQVEETLRRTRQKHQEIPPEIETPAPQESETPAAEMTRRTRQNDLQIPPESNIFGCSSSSGTLTRNLNILDIIKMRQENRGSSNSVYSEVFDTRNYTACDVDGLNYNVICKGISTYKYPDVTESGYMAIGPRIEKPMRRWKTGCLNLFVLEGKIHVVIDNELIERSTGSMVTIRQGRYTFKNPSFTETAYLLYMRSYEKETEEEMEPVAPQKGKKRGNSTSQGNRKRKKV